MKKNIIIIVIVAAVASLVFYFLSQRNPEINSSNEENKVIVYKSPTCGCCVKYISYLKSQGLKIETVTTNDTASVKNEHKISRDMESCHTAIFGDYFVEGHVPIEAVNKLLEEKPDIDGIALPEMPSGSPGMPGPKLEPFKIYSIKDGQASEFLSL
ncbi:hypothetical protein BMS3Abin15_00874 [bacterium BMS3Abin15]|nr:hypothetical protein BMS3Abin15_00874 [bacterium BMS3Abin15]HDZ84983.1 hypothetical protein [Candidatus Moranbacteria bacterium]